MGTHDVPVCLFSRSADALKLGLTVMVRISFHLSIIGSLVWVKSFNAVHEGVFEHSSWWNTSQLCV